MKGNLILIHGGGPTAVINASLAGAIRQAKKEPGVDRILAAIGGTGGLMRGQVRDLTDITEEELALLERTPGSAIGTSRDALEEPEYRLLAEKCVEFGAKYVLMNGGNGTMDACGKLCAMLEGTGIRVMGIPKTMVAEFFLGVDRFYVFHRWRVSVGLLDGSAGGRRRAGSHLSAGTAVRRGTIPQRCAETD